MARTNKSGIGYFPFDVDFFDDDKIKLVESEFGIKGGYLAVRLLCKIYKGNYFYKWGTDECLLFARTIGLSGVSIQLVGEVIGCLLRRDFLDKVCYEKYSILTSRGIQQRYFEATIRYKQVTVYKEYLLLDDMSKYKNVDIISINANINSKNDSINRQKKREEKEKEIENKPDGYIDFSFEFLDDEFRDSFYEWLAYKRKRKEKYKTQKSLELCYKRLMDYSDGDPVIARKIIESSQANNYSGIFELKETKKGGNDGKHPFAGEVKGKDFKDF